MNKLSNVWKESLGVKMILYKNIVLAVMTYWAGTWVIYIYIYVPTYKLMSISSEQPETIVREQLYAYSCEREQ